MVSHILLSLALASLVLLMCRRCKKEPKLAAAATNNVRASTALASNVKQSSDNKKKIDPKAVAPAKPVQKPAVKPVARQEAPKKQAEQQQSKKPVPKVFVSEVAQAKPVVKVIPPKASSYLDEKKEAVDKTQSNSSKPNHFNEDKWQERKAQTKTIDVGELATVTIVPVEASMRSLVVKNRVICLEKKMSSNGLKMWKRSFKCSNKMKLWSPASQRRRKAKAVAKIKRRSRRPGTKSR